MEFPQDSCHLFDDEGKAFRRLLEGSHARP
jgi:hypothetical protein